MYHGNDMPFFHNLKDMVAFYFKKKKFEKQLNSQSTGLKFKKIKYPFQMGGFNCDIGNLFSLTVEHYLTDIVKMNKYIDFWWSHCPENRQLKAIIFSNSPVHMDCYFLMKKIRENEGKVVYRQHGGIFGYSDHFIYYVQNFKLIDVFLTFGEVITKSFGKNSEQILKPDVLSKMKQVGEKYRGKDYDLYFGWSDERIYCSELIWKIYKEALNLEIGKLQKITDFDLSHPLVKAKLKERYGNNIPLDEPAISPANMFNSDLLETVYSE